MGELTRSCFHGPPTSQRLDLLVPRGWDSDSEAEPESEIAATDENAPPNDIMEAFWILSVNSRRPSQNQPRPRALLHPCRTARCSKPKNLLYLGEQRKTHFGAYACGKNGERLEQQVGGANSLRYLQTNKPSVAT